MSRIHPFCLMTALTALVVAGPAGSVEPGEALTACRAERDDAARLACYDAIRLDTGSPPVAATGDRAADSGPAAPSSIAVADPSPTAAGPANSGTGAAADASSAADPVDPRSGSDSREAEFGLEYSARNAPDRITSTVVEVQQSARGGLVMLLANDQVWQQTGNERLFLNAGDTVFLYRGAMTAFYLSTSENGRRYRVARLR